MLVHERLDKWFIMVDSYLLFFLSSSFGKMEMVHLPSYATCDAEPISFPAGVRTRPGIRFTKIPFAFFLHPRGKAGRDIPYPISWHSIWPIRLSRCTIRRILCFSYQARLQPQRLWQPFPRSWRSHGPHGLSTSHDGIHQLSLHLLHLTEERKHRSCQERIHELGSRR